MPELPEVETVVRSVAAHLRGKTISRAKVRSHRVTRQPFAETEERLTGAAIQDITRRGKQIFVELDRGVLYIHLGMTGNLLWNGVETKFTRAVLHFEDGVLLFNDIRQFGRFEFYPEIPAPLSAKGPDALTVSSDVFFERLQRYRGSIKAALLNQVFVAGIGNIYADEILFASRVHPKTPVARISRKRAQTLHQNTLAILETAVQHRGSTISNHVDASGEQGAYQNQHQVYGRAGEPCPHCGTPIRRTVIAQRGTHYCPRCQRA